MTSMSAAEAAASARPGPPGPAAIVAKLPEPGTSARAPGPHEVPPSPDEAGSGRQKPLGPAAIAAKLSELGTSAKGLSAEEARQRLAKDGPNAIVAAEEPLWHKLVGYFWGPIPWMIEAAALISLLRRDWADFAVVGGLLLYNAAVGFWQDAKAASALAALTGESLPVSKGVGDVAYSGSIAKQGDMQGVVTATGNATFFGRTAKLVAAAGSMSHAQRAVVQIGDFLILLAAALAVVLVGVEVYRDMVVAGQWRWDAAGDIAQFVLVLLVASVPVALPAVMSVTLALGALALSRQKAIVSRLSAIDELAGVDILCSDKTGTLTLNQLTLAAPIPFGGIKPEDIVFAAARATTLRPATRWTGPRPARRPATRSASGTA
jgi:H+-transporting ATPase